MSQPAQESAVVAFARLPRPGLVKTRLAAGVGYSAAAEFYRQCAEAVIAQLGRCRRRLLPAACRCRLLLALACWLELSPCTEQLH
jgi:glycosyltransferase A (GT-A) superfamily protein (DUF2064 family)